jgi:outer membrane scaffolding protein for murein synthesis (MipA/OmpV family)
MRSRFSAKKTLAPAVTANWLIIMASIAGASIGAASAQAADQDYITSMPDAKASKWSVVAGGGGAYAPDYEGSDDYEFEPFPFVSIVYDDFIFINGPSLGVNLVDIGGLKAGPIARYSFGRDEDDNHALDGLAMSMTRSRSAALRTTSWASGRPG